MPAARRLAKPLSKTFFRLRALSGRIWIRVTAYVVLALATVLGSPALSRFLPEKFETSVKPDTVLDILAVLSSSMLAVTTFSLSVIVSARQSITSGITPRAHKVATESATTQNVLATFLGAFVYALAAQVVLQTGFYGGRSSAIILVVTIFVLFLVVAAMLRWIDELSRLGSIPSTVAAIEEDSARAIALWRVSPSLGARALGPDAPATEHSVAAAQSGYILHIDLPALDRLAEEAGGTIVLDRQPGAFVARGQCLCRFSGALDQDKIAAAFSFGPARNANQDPRYGLIILTEIAQRALSPAVNDPGTAIFILGRHVAHLIGDADAAAEPAALPNVWMAPVTANQILEAAFDPIARDGAGLYEIQVRTQKSLALLYNHAENGIADAARRASERALAYGLDGLPLEHEREALQRLASELRGD